MSMTRHSHRVRFAKQMLSGIIVLMLAALALTVAFHHENDRFNLSYQSLQQGEEETPAMVEPKLQGVDAQGRPYRVEAELAEQLGPQKIRLHNLHANLFQHNTPTRLEAMDGMVWLDKEEVALQGNIELWHGAEYYLTTEKAHIWLKQGTIEGDSPLSGQSSLGQLQAGHFRVTEGGDRLWFGKRVRLVYHPAERPSISPPPTEASSL